MARAVLRHYDDGVARTLWQATIVWGAQRIADPKLLPFGARVYVRHAPAALLGKLQARAVQGVFLHRSLRTPGAVVVGIMHDGDEVRGLAERKTMRAACAEDGS